MAALPAAEAGGRPAANAATHSSPKTSVHVDTVFSFTPRTGFSSIGVGELVAAATIVCGRRRGLFLLDFAFGIPVLPYLFRWFAQLQLHLRRPPGTCRRGLWTRTQTILPPQQANARSHLGAIRFRRIHVLAVPLAVSSHKPGKFLFKEAEERPPGVRHEVEDPRGEPFRICIAGPACQGIEICFAVGQPG